MGMIGNIENSGKKLLRLITNYNFYNRLVNIPESFFNSGKQHVVYSTMILDSIPYEIASHYDRVKDLKMEVENATIKITNECFTKLVEELTDNAFKFSQNNTNVTIKAEIKSDKYVIQFIDEGVEFSEEQFMGIGAFEQFGRDHKEQQGTGMGLAIVSQIVKLWNGKLELTTKPGGITIFQVTLETSDEEVTL
jgi:K+-sensing histidine kinase KdpD